MLILLVQLLFITNCSKCEPKIITKTKYLIVPIKKLDYNISTDYTDGKMLIHKNGDSYLVPIKGLNTFFNKYKYQKGMNMYKDSIIHGYEDIIDRHNKLKY